MNTSNKFYIYLAAVLIGIVIILCAGLGFLSATILVKTAANNDFVLFIAVTIFIAVLSLGALGLIGLSVKSTTRKSVEEIHVMLKRFKNGGGFTHHSDDEAGEVVVAFEGVMKELHGLLQSVQTKAQALEHNMGALTKGIYQVAADQTNLFSLNAAIEAARSQQDGFSVISGEILSLVERTGHLTDDIRNMAGQLRAGVNEVITELEHALRRVDLTRINVPMDACAGAVQEKTDNFAS